jgi:hypothetical protein
VILAILVIATIVAIASPFLFFGLAAVGSGLAHGASSLTMSFYSLVFALALIAPVIAIGGWLMYLASRLGLPYGWAIGLALLLLLLVVPKFVLTPAADKVARSYQANDIPLTAIEPRGTIAIQAEQYRGYRPAAKSKEDLAARLLLSGFDGVLVLDSKRGFERNAFEHITLKNPGGPHCDALQSRLPLKEALLSFDGKDWDSCFETETSMLGAADIAFVSEREILQRKKVMGVPHTFEIRRERVVKNTDGVWRDIGRETWVKHDSYKRPYITPASVTRRPKGREKPVDLRGLLPAVWPGFKTTHQHPPQLVTPPIPLFATAR